MTKNKFITYEKIRRSGITNMFDIEKVITLSELYGCLLTKEDCLDIMKNYCRYYEKYNANIEW